MLAVLNAVSVLASEAHGIPGSDWRAKVAVPLGILIFIGSVYLLVRANLGSRRGYLVLSTSLWGFMVIYALFWTFGAPGTPPTTGPQNLPGQEADAYQPVWRPFAGDSNIANDPDYAVAKSFPEGFSEQPPPSFTGSAEDGAADTLDFFASEPQLQGTVPVKPTWAADPESVRYAEAGNGYTIIAVTLRETYQIGADGEEPEGEVGQIIPDGQEYTAFAYFDPGSPLFPSLVVLGLMMLLFAVHAALLALDERRERRDRGAEVEQEAEPERVPAAG